MRKMVLVVAILASLMVVWLSALAVVGPPQQAPRAMDVLRLILTWPVAAVAMFLILVTVFEDALADLIKNMRLFAKWRDVQVEVQRQQQSSEPTPPAVPAPAPPQQGDELAVQRQTAELERAADIDSLRRSALDIARVAVTETHRANVWHFAYLTVWLAPNSQAFLRWLAGLNRPATQQEIQVVWLPAFGQPELDAVEAALVVSSLMRVNGEVVEISPYGREFLRALDDPGFASTVQWATWLRGLAGRGWAAAAAVRAPQP